MSSCDFTYKHYEEILDIIKKNDYKDTFFNETSLYDRELILRHDIDLDMESAYRMALLENRHKIRSTYCILVRSPFYNIFDKSNSDFVRGILALGHQIGLHFDETFYGSNDKESIINNVASEAQLLADNFNTDIFAVSFHRPSQFILNSDIKLRDNLFNTYDRIFTKEFKYISDSRRIWKDGCLCKFLEKADGTQSIRKIQALVHPLWWSDKSMSAQDTMDEFLLKKLRYIDDALEKNVQVYKKLYE